MTEENVAEQGAEEAAAPVEKPDLPQRDDGTYVDFSDVRKVDPVLADRAERRISYMNARMKSWETQAMEQAKFNKTLVSRLEKLEDGDFRERMDSIQSKRQEAYESGDLKKVAELDNELIEYKIAERTRKPTEVKEPEFPKEADQPLSDDQMDVLASWAQERDESNKPLRPWANPSHADHKKALRYIEAATVDPDNDISTPEGFRSLLETVDKKMTRPKTAAVLSGNGDGRPAKKAGAVKLSPEAMRVAEGMGYTPEQYAKLISKYQEK